MSRKRFGAVYVEENGERGKEVFGCSLVMACYDRMRVGIRVFRSLRNIRRLTRATTMAGEEICCYWLMWNVLVVTIFGALHYAKIINYEITVLLVCVCNFVFAIYVALDILIWWRSKRKLEEVKRNFEEENWEELSKGRKRVTI